MKNLLGIVLLAVVSMTVSACNNKEEAAQSPESIFCSYLNNFIHESETEGLNPEEFAAILSGKRWHDTALVSYDIDWNNPEVIYATIDGKTIVPMAPGHGISYVFNPDGSGLYGIDAYPQEKSLTWSWDPSTMTLEIDHAMSGGSIKHIQSFSKDRFVEYETITYIDSETGGQRPYIQQRLFVLSK